MENVRNRTDVRVVSNKNDYLKLTLNPSYMSRKILDNNLVAIHKSKSILKLNKRACVEMYTLDLSKVLMYEFHYAYIKNKYGNNSRFLLNDIDGFMYEIKTEDVYEDLSKDKDIVDIVIIQLSQSNMVIQANKLLVR